jgi:hypothetical protein
MFSNVFGGSSSSPSHNEEDMAKLTAPENRVPACEPYLKSFLDCMDKSYQDSSACQTYMDMLKQCRGDSSISATPSSTSVPSESWY